MIKSVCLSGGGITGFAHIGMLQKLHEDNLLTNVNTIVGTSIGAVVGTLFGIGMVPLAIYHEFAQINDVSVLKYTDLDSFFQSFGIDTGEYFMAHLIDIFIDRKTCPKITFLEFQQKFKKRMILTGTNINTHQTEYFSPDTTPNMRILDAVRISISIPFLFSAIELNGNFYVDGGVTDNYPLQYCLKDFTKRYPLEDPMMYVLGCNIESLFPRKVLSIEDFIYNIFACSMKKDRQETTTTDNTIFIKMEKTGSTDFAADISKRKDMYVSGHDAAEKYISLLHKRRRRMIERRNSASF